MQPHIETETTIAARSLTLLNERGDTSITWQPEQDDAMEEIIRRKMEAGVTFFTISARKPGQRGRVAAPKQLKNAADARKHRALSIPDADFSKFVLEGKGEAVPTPSEPAQIVSKAKTPKEVASGHSVGVKPRRGG